MKKAWLVLGFLAFILLLSGCNGGLFGGGGSKITAFNYRVTNAVPDLGGNSSVDYVAQVDGDPNEQSFLGTFSYLQFSNYFEHKEQDIYIDYIVKEASTTNELDAISVDIIPDTSVHILFLGLVNAAPSQKSARLTAIPIDRGSPSGSKARIIVVHGFNRDATHITPNIDLAKPGDDIPIVSNVQFGNSTLPPDEQDASQYSAEITSGTYTFEVRIAGNKDAVLFTDGPFTLQAGKIYVLLISGEEGNSVWPPKITLIEEPVKN
ncbi:MAG TPA: hypothetical protein VNK96_00355 [Fimbriimonadales bacterium]|nr:hypothetical protein [Fimbriimonadales bacterium]